MSAVEHPCPNCGESDSELDTRFDVFGGFCEVCGLVMNSDAVLDAPLEDKTQTQNEEASKKWSAKARDSSEEVLIGLLVDLDNLAPNLFLTKVELDRSSELLVQVWEKNLLHGRKREHIIGAVLVIALRDLKKPRPLGIVANELGVDRVSIQRTIKKILREIPLSLSPPLAVDYLPFIGANLTLDQEVQSAAARVLEQCEAGLGDPATTAAAALYLVAKPRGIPITYRSAGAAAGSTKETVWKRAKLLRDR